MKPKKNLQLKAGVIITVGMLFASFSFYFYQIFFTPNIQLKKDNFYLYIPTGATFDAVRDTLNKNDVLNDKVSFYFLSKLTGYTDKVKPGRYLLTSNSNNLNTIKMLKRGTQSPVKLTYNNIRLKSELVEKLSSRFEFSSEELLSILNNEEFAKRNGLDTTTIISLFIPNTYEIYWNTTAEKFMDRIINEYQKFWNGSRDEKAESIGMSKAQVSILASIVEAETAKNSEKSRVAGVYVNRLKSNMPLQADPTIKFAVGDFSLKRIYSGHLATESPYNTYKYTGLPPGPINLPSISSIDAVLNYERHKYIYFCANSQLNGYHEFAETYDQHRENAESYRKALNRLNIK
ncbi:MAG TPA: endolytic transglycosylase MltG [Cytophagaceae bacterium]|jgi:UPF0755 protein